MRKKRSDRTHLVYRIVCAKTGAVYIGITVLCDSAVKRTLRNRLHRHFSRAEVQDKAWALCKAIRKYGRDNFTIELVGRVRGKLAAHTLEVSLIDTLNPKLNTHKKY